MKKSDSIRLHRLLRVTVRELRIEAGLRQADVARLIGEPQSVISKIESGERKLSVVDLSKICKALKVPLGEAVRRWEAMQ